jgi:hypothetical protein
MPIKTALVETVVVLVGGEAALAAGTLAAFGANKYGNHSDYEYLPFI